MKVIPLTLSQLNEFVELHHRHHKKVQGHRFSLGLLNDEGALIGACSVGRPVARNTDPYLVAEVTRLVTDGTYNACSMLYSAAARACKAMVFEKIQTFILESEPGTSLKATGWSYEGLAAPSNFHVGRENRKHDTLGRKQKWSKSLN